MLLHASAPELCRLFSQRRAGIAAAEAPCPIVLAEDRPDSVTHAYAAMKLLTQRAGLPVFDLVLGAAPNSPRAERIASQMATCADSFFGAVLRDWARIDPGRRGHRADRPGAGPPGRPSPGRRADGEAGASTPRPAATAGHAFS